MELRYRAFLDALGGKLDAGWSWEDTDSAYILLDGLSLKEEAASLGRYLVEDFAHYAVSRKQRGIKDLLIIDEYSALSQSGTDAANLVERLRSYGCAVILSSQSYAGLGPLQDAERILDAANWVLLHSCAAPERLTRRAGKAPKEKETYTVGGGLQHGMIRASQDEEDAIHPDEARRLQTGEAILIAHGQFIRARIAQPPPLPHAAIDHARAWIDQKPASPKAPQRRQNTKPLGPKITKRLGPPPQGNQTQAGPTKPSQKGGPELI